MRTAAMAPLLAFVGLWPALALRAGENADAIPEKVGLEIIRPEVLDRLLALSKERKDLPDDLLRTAADRLVALEKEHGSEALFTHSQSRSHFESIDRNWTACRIPLTGRWRLAAVGKREFYAINFPDSGERISADLARLEIRGEWARDPRFLIEAGVEPYGGTAAGLAAAAAVRWSAGDEWQFALAAFAHRPWDDSAYAVDSEGHVNGWRLWLSGWPHSRLWCLADIGAETYTVSERAGETDGGCSWEGGLRCGWAIWRQPNKVAGAGFLERSARGDEAIEDGFHLFAAGRWKEHEAPADFTAVPYIDRSSDLRTGMEWRQTAGKHMAWIVSGYIGEDQERLIPWQRLYGMQARIFLIPTQGSRLWAGWEMNSESGTAVGGRTVLLEWGVNLDF